MLSKSSLVVGEQDLFDALPLPVAKQFVEKSLKGFSPEDLLRAHLLFALPYAALTQAELIKKVQENAPELEVRENENSVRLSFNAAASENILNLVHAAQALLSRSA